MKTITTVMPGNHGEAGSDGDANEAGSDDDAGSRDEADSDNDTASDRTSGSSQSGIPMGTVLETVGGENIGPLDDPGSRRDA